MNKNVRTALSAFVKLRNLFWSDLEAPKVCTDLNVYVFMPWNMSQ